MNIPNTLEDIDASWMGRALNAEVSACHVTDSHSGTTGRGTLEVSYANDTDLPKRFFIKLPPADELQKAFVCSSGMGRREALFYQQLSAEVPVRVPYCYYANSNASGDRYIMLLEHLEDSACTFQNASANYSLDYVRTVLSAFAKLHARYWESPRFSGDLEWVQPPLQHAIAVQLVDKALGKFGSSMPSVFQEMAKLYLAETDAIHRLWNTGESTLIHGDVHDGNLFFDGNHPGFLDWAILARGPGMRDVGYFLAGTMTPNDREAHQREMLVHYRDQLITGGIVPPSLADLWRQYQCHVAYVWVGATVTLAMGDEWQPINYTRKTLSRINEALEDLGSVAAIRAMLGGS